MVVAKTNAQVIRAENAVTAHAQVICEVVSPIGIIKVKDMYFGNIVSGNSGSVVLSPEGGRAVVNGNVALDGAGSISSALFEINDGLGNSPATQRFFTGYSITLPSNDITLVNERGGTMRVSNFTSNASASGTGNFVNGTGVLTVGATLYVSAAQGLGNYVSSDPFPVTVNFY